jgi:hypothetical protein
VGPHFYEALRPGAMAEQVVASWSMWQEKKKKVRSAECGLVTKKSIALRIAGTFQKRQMALKATLNLLEAYKIVMSKRQRKIRRITGIAVNISVYGDCGKTLQNAMEQYNFCLQPTIT